MIALPHVPNGYKEIVDTYGDPASKKFARERLAQMKLPMPMRASWNEKLIVKSAWIHVAVAGAMLDALKEIREFGGLEFLQMQNLDRWGGVHNFRMKVGDPSSLSTHAWAIAIDINPHKGPYGKRPNMPDWIVSAFVRRGFVWGGDWTIPDGMHFQACKGY